MRNKEKKVKTTKKKSACLPCLITCLVVVVVLVVGVVVASNVVFNTYVSPMIGGVKLHECISLVNGALKSNRKKIVTDEFSETDLNDFYYSLNSMLYQKEMTDADYEQRYSELSDEEKAKYGSLEAYKTAHPYRIDLDSISSAMNLEELIKGDGGTTDENPDENGDVSTAGEIEEGGETTDPPTGEQDGEQLKALFNQLAFDFSSLKDYPYMSEYEDYKYTSFQITGKQISAVISEMISVVFGAVDKSSFPEQLREVDLTAYAGIPQVIAVEEKYTDENEIEKTRTKLSVTLEVKVKDLVKEAVAPMMTEQGIPQFVVNIVGGILPKDFFVSLETYPTDEKAECNLRINNYSDKMSANLKKIVNALTENGNINLFPSNEQPSDGEQPSTDESGTVIEETKPKDNLFNQLNSLVVDVFGKINEYVPVQFVSNEEGSMTLRISHIQGLLKTLGLFDENDLENSVTPHLFLSTLRCIVGSTNVVSNEENLDSLYLQMEQKYGIDKTYWNEHDLFDKETLNNIVSEIDLTNVTFEENKDMRVFIREGQMTKLMSDAIKSGLFDAKDEVSTAGETAEGNESSSILGKFTFSNVKINGLSEEKVSDYKYVDKDEIEHTLFSGKKVIYDLGAVLTVDFADLLTTSQTAGVDNVLFDTLKKALPEKLAIGLVIKIAEVYDNNGNLFHRVIGSTIEKTQIIINDFDAYYSDRVLNTLKIMVQGLTKDDSSESSSFDIGSISETIESSFADVFDTIKDSLCCDILLSTTDQNDNQTGCLVLPSVYELVHGTAEKQVKESDSLNESDLLTISEIKDLFVQVYNTDIYVAESGTLPPEGKEYDKVITKFDSTEGDELLSELSRKYYMKNNLTSESLFGDVGFDFDANSFDFNGEDGLYHDTTAIQDLDVSVSGDALASLISSSGKLDSLTTDENNFLSGLNILTCSYSWINETLYLNFEFVATLKAQSSSTSLDISSLLPSEAYITARILLYDSTSTENDYTTDILLNDKSINNLVKLVKIFSKTDFDTETITNQVKDSVKDAFDTIKDNVNFKYSIGNNNRAFFFKNIFNTLNKLSHKDNGDEVSRADHLAYESLSDSEKEADDIYLRFILQEFGRAPSYSSKTDVHGEREYMIVSSADIDYFDDDPSAIYKVSDADEFFDDVNKNYYISDDKLLNYESLKSMTSVSSDLIGFAKLYQDTRTIDEMSVDLTSNRFTALANQIVGDISISEKSDTTVSMAGEGEIATAKIIQTKIISDGIDSSLEIIVFVEINSTDEVLANLLPSHLFLTATVDLSAKDELGNKTYATNVFINNYTEQHTTDLFAKIKKLQSTLNTDLGFDIDTLKTTLQDQVKNVFENNMNMFGELKIKDGYIDLPNIFEYVTSGTISADGVYDENKPIFEPCDLSTTNGSYGIDESGNAGYYDGANFIVLGEAVKNDGIWGYVSEGKFIAIQTLPEQLMYNLRSFGKKPTETTINIGENDILGYDILDYDNTIKNVREKAGKNISAISKIDIKLQDEEDGFYFARDDYYFDEESYFFDLINTNYYITNPEKKITSETINTDKVFVLDNNLFDFDKLYNDQRTFADMSIRLKGSLFAGLAESFYSGGIAISDTDKAKIVQMHIFTKDLAENIDNLLGEATKYTTLRTIVKVEFSEKSNSLGVLPDYVYVICYTIIDAEAGDRRFETEFIINDFGYDYVDPYLGVRGQIDETERFIDRLNVIKSSFGLTYDFDLDEMKIKIRDSFKDIFEKNLSTFGELKYEKDTVIVPNIFQYMTEGQLIRESGTTTINYFVGEEYAMREADGTTLTDPEVLRKRFVELGTGSKYNGQSIPVWNSAGKYYNDNIYAQSDLDKFYSDIQAYYFLAKLPTASDFIGNGSYFDDLDGASFDSVFNLRGITTSETGIKGDYLKKGLYNYAGEQAILRMSDKAIAGLINDQNSIITDETMKVESVAVTSVKLDYIDEKHMTIEITLRINTNSSGSMPKCFYLTTITQRNVETGTPEYSTRLTVNAFTPEDLDNFLANVKHVEHYSKAGLIENLTTDKIAQAVENALSETLDGKLASYIDGFGKYNDSNDGVGYIAFPNIYSKILSTTGARQGNEKDMQNVIVKLNNANATLYKNKYSSTDTPVLMQSYLTDKQFGFSLNALLKADSANEYITVEQAVIFKGIADGYADYENFIKNADSSFAFESTDSGYYLITVSIATSNVSCAMQLAPEKMYLSLLIDADGNLVRYVDQKGETQTVKIIQDFTSSEQALFLSIFSDGDNKLDIDSTIENKAKSVMNYVTNKTLNQHTDFSEYYGYVGSK